MRALFWVMLIAFKEDLCSLLSEAPIGFLFSLVWLIVLCVQERCPASTVYAQTVGVGMQHSEHARVELPA